MDAWQDRLAALRAQMPGADEPEELEPCTSPQMKSEQKGRLDIILDKKGRAGKTATIISGFTIDDDAVAALAADLKKLLVQVALPVVERYLFRATVAMMCFVF